MVVTLKTGQQLSIGNWMLERLSEEEFELHYLGDGWQSRVVTLQDIDKAGTFFELFNNLKL